MSISRTSTAPGVTRPGTRINAPESLVNIYATLVELAGLPAKEGIDSQSLVPLLKKQNVKWERPALMTQGRGNHAVRSRDWRYIRYADGSEELYDMQADPGQQSITPDQEPAVQLQPGELSAGFRLPIESVALQALVSEPIKPCMDVVVMANTVHGYMSQSDKGEMVIGAMSFNPTVLMTVADLSVTPLLFFDTLALQLDQLVDIRVGNHALVLDLSNNHVAAETTVKPANSHRVHFSAS